MNLPGSTLRDYLRIIFRHKAIIITTFITVIVVTIIGLELKTPMYESQVKMLITAEKPTISPYYTRLGRGGKITTTQSEIVVSNPVIERAVRTLKLDERPSDYEKYFCSPLKAWWIDLRRSMAKKQVDPARVTAWLTDLRRSISEGEADPVHIEPEKEQTSLSGGGMHGTELYDGGEVSWQSDAFRWAVEGLRSRIEVIPIENTDLFTINVRDFSPIAAATIANVVSRSYVIFDLEQQMAEFQLQYGEKHPVIVQLENAIDQMTRNLTGGTLPAIEAIGPASVKIIEQAKVPSQPIGRSKQVMLPLAISMSLFLGVILAFGFEYIDHTFKSPQDVETFLNLPLLGCIPKKGFRDGVLIKDSKRNASLLQPYQNLSDQLYLLMKDKNLKSVLITAASPSDGSSSITANIANFLSNKAGHKVMVIDVNLRSPSKINRLFNISENGGLANVLEGKIPLEKAVRVISSNLTVLPSGSTSLNPTPLLDSTSMLNVMKIAKEEYEFVLVDYASLKNFKDACVLSPHLDGVALVINEGKTRHHTIKTLISPLKHKKANLIGVVLKNRTYAIPKMIYERF